MSEDARIVFVLLVTTFLVGLGIRELKSDDVNNPVASKYELVEHWPQLPGGFVLGNPTGVDVDSEGSVWVFHRRSRRWSVPMPQAKIVDNTVTQLDSSTGQLLKSWGSNRFIMPHGLMVDKANHVWVTDVGLHQVFKFDSNGELLLILGEAGVSGLDDAHFNLPADVAVSSDGSIYVADGYGNSRVVKFSAEGRYLTGWGTKGRGEDEFRIPHGIDLDRDGNIYVADRENNRIKKYNAAGSLLSIWQNKEADQLYSVSMHPNLPRLFGIDYEISEQGEILGSDIILFDLDLNLKARVGRSGGFNGPISRYHDIVVDKRGNVYVGDILGNTIQKFSVTP
jgi:peptidylamidoglycolate lyase